MFVENLVWDSVLRLCIKTLCCDSASRGSVETPCRHCMSRLSVLMVMVMVLVLVLVVAMVMVMAMMLACGGSIFSQARGGKFNGGPNKGGGCPREGVATTQRMVAAPGKG